MGPVYYSGTDNPRTERFFKVLVWQSVAGGLEVTGNCTRDWTWQSYAVDRPGDFHEQCVIGFFICTWAYFHLPTISWLSIFFLQVLIDRGKCLFIIFKMNFKEITLPSPGLLHARRHCNLSLIDFVLMSCHSCFVFFKLQAEDIEWS